MRNLVSLIFLVLASASFAQTEAPNPGPRTSTEPSVLYKEGTKALKSKDFVTAIRAFQRLVDRYPLSDYFTDSHFLLGQAYLGSGQPGKAIGPLSDYVKNHFSDPQGNVGRLNLVEAYRDENKLSEARAVVEEIFKQNPSSQTQALALLYKTSVLTVQNKLPEALASLDAYEHLLEQNHISDPDDSLNASTRLHLKIAVCTSTPLPSEPKAKDEALWVKYLDSVTACFKEALVPANPHLSQKEFHFWCENIKNQEAHLIKASKDPSFNPKIKTSVKAVIDFAKTESPELVRCYGKN